MWFSFNRDRPQYARAACRATFREFALDLAVSSGLACALTPSSIGELFIGTGVIPPRSAGPAEWHPSIICDRMSGSMTLTLAQAAGLPARTGRSPYSLHSHCLACRR